MIETKEAQQNVQYRYPLTRVELETALAKWKENAVSKYHNIMALADRDGYGHMFPPERRLKKIKRLDRDIEEARYELKYPPTIRLAGLIKYWVKMEAEFKEEDDEFPVLPWLNQLSLALDFGRVDDAFRLLKAGDPHGTMGVTHFNLDHPMWVDVVVE